MEQLITDSSPCRAKLKHEIRYISICSASSVNSIDTARTTGEDMIATSDQNTRGMYMSLLLMLPKVASLIRNGGSMTVDKFFILNDSC